MRVILIPPKDVSEKGEKNMKRGNLISIAFLTLFHFKQMHFRMMRNLISIAFLTLFAVVVFANGGFELRVGMFFGILIGLGLYDVYMRDKMGQV